MVSKELTAASSKPLLLSILAQGDSYGYAIIQAVRARSDGRLDWTEGMLYPVLHRLERDGHVRSRWKTSESGRKRKYYTLSAKGRLALDAEREQWRLVHATLSAFWEAEPCSS